MSAPVISVPLPPRTAYNPNRPLIGNALLRNQVEHLHVHELTLPPEQRSGIDFASIRTEGEAAAYIRKMHSIIAGSQTRKSGS